MIISMHVNRKNINHDLSNDDIDRNQKTKSHTKTIVSLEVFDSLFRKENGLFVNYETIHEHHTSSKQGIQL